MRGLFFACLVGLLLEAGSAWAAKPLSDAQMDQVSAGDLPSCAGSAMCSGVSTSQTSTTITTTNRQGVVTTTTTNTGPITTTLGSGIGGTIGGTGGTGTGGGTGTTEPASIPLTPNVSIFAGVIFPH